MLLLPSVAPNMKWTISLSFYPPHAVFLLSIITSGIVVYVQLKKRPAGNDPTGLIRKIMDIT